jgi:exodeoxyribonuclease VII small subunit
LSGDAAVPVAQLSYGEASRELDQIVADFEHGDLDVDQLVDRLERATAIVEELDRRLRRTRARVEELVPKLESAVAQGAPGADPGGPEAPAAQDEPGDPTGLF